jgi:hypothetical protein
MTRPRRPKVEACAALTGRAVARELFTAPVVLARTAEALLAADAAEFAASMAVMGDGMGQRRVDSCQLFGIRESRRYLLRVSSLEQEDGQGRREHHVCVYRTLFCPSRAGFPRSLQPRLALPDLT